MDVVVDILQATGEDADGKITYGDTDDLRLPSSLRDQDRDELRLPPSVAQIHQINPNPTRKKNVEKVSCHVMSSVVFLSVPLAAVLVIVTTQTCVNRCFGVYTCKLLLIDIAITITLHGVRIIEVQYTTTTVDACTVCGLRWNFIR